MRTSSLFFTNLHTPLDVLTIAWTERGVRHVFLSDTAEEGYKELMGVLSLEKSSEKLVQPYHFDQEEQRDGSRSMKQSQDCHDQKNDDLKNDDQVMHDTYREWVSQVAKIVSHPEEALNLSVPLDLVGTDFQKRVWERLRELSKGATISYSQLAQEVCGGARFARAVAGACAANTCAVLVPCHRVVGRHSQGGYRWGNERKAVLLGLEKIPAQQRIGL